MKENVTNIFGIEREKVEIKVKRQFWDSLQNAVNLTSRLLGDLGEIQNGGLENNILLSCEKLEKFVLQYASLHMTLQNGSETELSMEQKEIGKALKKIL